MRKMLRELGRIGGKKGGKARAQRMTPGERREAARKAVLARWAQEKERKPREEAVRSWCSARRSTRAKLATARSR